MKKELEYLDLYFVPMQSLSGRIFTNLTVDQAKRLQSKWDKQFSAIGKSIKEQIREKEKLLSYVKEGKSIANFTKEEIEQIATSLEKKIRFLSQKPKPY